MLRHLLLQFLRHQPERNEIELLGRFMTEDDSRVPPSELVP